MENFVHRTTPLIIDGKRRRAKREDVFIRQRARAVLDPMTNRIGAWQVEIARLHLMLMRPPMHDRAETAGAGADRADPPRSRQQPNRTHAVGKRVAPQGSPELMGRRRPHGARKPGATPRHH